MVAGAEIDALLAAPDRSTRLGSRDHAMLILACQTGLRVLELIGLRRHRHRHRRRRRRAPPLHRQVPQRPSHALDQTNRCRTPCLASRPQRRAGRRTVRHQPRPTTLAGRGRQDDHQTRCPRRGRLPEHRHQARHTAHPATFRGGAAARRGGHLGHRAVARGHEDPGSTQAYLHADMTLKEQALARVAPPHTSPGRPRRLPRIPRQHLSPPATPDYADQPAVLTPPTSPFTHRSA